MKGDNADDIKAKKEELTQSFYKISEEIYKQAAAAQQAAGGAQQNPGAGAQGNAPGQDGYYETNYTDVEDVPTRNNHFYPLSLLPFFGEKAVMCYFKYTINSGADGATE